MVTEWLCIGVQVLTDPYMKQLWDEGVDRSWVLRTTQLLLVSRVTELLLGLRVLCDLQGTARLRLSNRLSCGSNNNSNNNRNRANEHRIKSLRRYSLRTIYIFFK